MAKNIIILNDNGTYTMTSIQDKIPAPILTNPTTVAETVVARWQLPANYISTGLSLRVNADGKSVTACVYDSKTFKSFSDNTADGMSNRPRKGSNFTPLTNTYQRYLWNIKL